jgi:hypothetical protein
MTREIKFRAWHLLSKEMLYEGWNKDSFVDKAAIFGLGESAEIMQYTGLKDKNGKEIYEGDIDQDGGVFTWVQDSCSFCIDYTDIELSPIDGEVKDWCEIKGNIYENPELLQK